MVTWAFYYSIVIA